MSKFILMEMLTGVAFVACLALIYIALILIVPEFVAQQSLVMIET